MSNQNGNGAVAVPNRWEYDTGDRVQQSLAVIERQTVREKEQNTKPSIVGKPGSQNDELAAKLTRIPFESLQEDLPAGMQYTTPVALVESGETSYSLRHIHWLIRHGLIPARRLFNQYVLEPGAVEQLLERDRERGAPGAPRVGRPPQNPPQSRIR